MNSLQPRSPSPHRRRTQKAISGQVAGGIRKDSTDENNCIFRLIGSEAAKLARRVTKALGQALWQKEFGPDAVTAERAKVDPALMDAIDIALARQVPSEE